MDAGGGGGGGESFQISSNYFVLHRHFNIPDHINTQDLNLKEFLVPRAQKLSNDAFFPA